MSSVASEVARYRLVVGLLVIVVGVLAVVAFRRSGSTAAPAPAQSNLRAAVDEAIRTETPGLDTPQAVDAYLERLEKRAREQGKVTAVEIEPGITAIDRLRGTLGEERVAEKRNRFSRRMEQLQFELMDAGR
jgi:hypothetical protein